ncbi:hypothetical protein T484DRAFT_1980505, partial [Baffinella frigidus]
MYETKAHHNLDPPPRVNLPASPRAYTAHNTKPSLHASPPSLIRLTGQPPDPIAARCFRPSRLPVWPFQLPRTG